MPYFRAKWAAEQAVASSRRRARRPPAELRLRRRRRRAAALPAHRASRAGDARDRARDAARAADLDRRRRPRRPARARSRGRRRRPVELGGPEAVTWNALWSRMKAALGTRRPAFHIPFWLARGPAALFERMPPALADPRSAPHARGPRQRRLGRRAPRCAASVSTTSSRSTSSCGEPPRSSQRPRHRP